MLRFPLDVEITFSVSGCVGLREVLLVTAPHLLEVVDRGGVVSEGIPFISIHKNQLTTEPMRMSVIALSPSSVHASKLETHWIRKRAPFL